MDENLLNRVVKKTNVDKNTIIDLALKLSNGNMKDEKTLNEVDAKETKSKIIKTIKDDNVPKNIDKMF